MDSMVEDGQFGGKGGGSRGQVARWKGKNVQCVLYLFIIIDRANDFSQFFNFDICENTNV